MNISQLVALFYVLVVITCFANPALSKDRNTNHLDWQHVELLSEGGYPVSGGFINGNSGQAVVFVPEMSLDKTSWFDLANQFAKVNIASLSLSGNAVKSAVEYLKGQGFDKIVLVGAGMGGEAILDTVQMTPRLPVEKIAVLSPYEAIPITDQKIIKLFIASKKDWQVLYSEVLPAYLQSSEPKKLHAYEGDAHGQSLFESNHGDHLVNLLLDFIKN